MAFTMTTFTGVQRMPLMILCTGDQLISRQILSIVRFDDLTLAQQCPLCKFQRRHLPARIRQAMRREDRFGDPGHLLCEGHF